MADYISREAAYKTLTEYYHHSSGVQHTVLREALNRVPAADVRPVARGKWIKKFMGFPPEPHTLCSCCEYDPDFAVFDLIEYDGCIGLKPFRPNFCPNCGADMR